MNFVILIFSAIWLLLFILTLGCLLYAGYVNRNIYDIYINTINLRNQIYDAVKCDNSKETK